jgi:tRNA threonylcarbamoyladenosine biosynthesis protein TsaE
MDDKAVLWLPDADSTHSAGRSLARCFYSRPVTVFLRGELGAGKTTFIQGLGFGLGLLDALASPTYALEQRYPLPSNEEFLHIDLYRLDRKSADDLIASSDGFCGIRCIEWAERMSSYGGERTIDVLLQEDRGGRRLEIVFRDLMIPAASAVEAWRDDVALPRHIRDHCDAVAELSRVFADALLQRGVILRPLVLKRAAELHDLFRFLDFRPGAAPDGIEDDPREAAVHVQWKTTFMGLRHEPACAKFLRERGFPQLADVVAVHGLELPSPPRPTIEQKVLFYADKRVLGDRIVTLEERFSDFRKRYGAGKESPVATQWMAEVETVERQLFPEGPPL